MIRKLFFLLAIAGCASGFGKQASNSRLAVEFDGEQALGTREKRLPLALNAPAPYKVRIRALNQDGTADTSFSRFVRIAVKPGSVQSVVGAGSEGRNVYLREGVSEVVTISIQGAFGPTRIVAEDLGYVPSDPAKAQCSDGLDNDGDGLFDGADDGCAFSNDDTEESASFINGASPPIYYALPRVADVRGRTFDAMGNPQGGAATSFPKQQVEVDTGYRENVGPDGYPRPMFEYSTIVTRVSSDGFYFTDLGEGAFSSLFAFNFNTPPGMRVCDRLKSLRGTALDFFGATQLSFPTWTLEEWDPKPDPVTKKPTNPCPVPEPTVLKAADLMVNGAFTDQQGLLKVLAGLVRVESRGTSSLRVTRHFGRGNVVCTKKTGAEPTADGNLFTCPITDEASNCDLNGDGRVDFAVEPEKSCASACTNDPECTEWSNFAARAAFQLVVQDSGNNILGKIQADGSASSSFHAHDLRGQPLRAFTGSLRFFSGGTQFTVEARCKDDIVTTLDAEVPPIDRTCVFPRSVVDNNSGTQ